MRSRRGAAFAATLFCLYGGLSIAGCGGDEGDQCRSTDACLALGVDVPISPTCVPLYNTDPVPSGCGVFVSASLGDDAHEGTRGAPVKTFARAIALSLQKQAPIYACAETFQESLSVPSGTTLFGGLDCHDGWRYIGGLDRTTVQGKPNEPAVVLKSGKRRTRMDDFFVRASDAAAPGASSIALIADHTAADLNRVDMLAGKGAAGADGVSPMQDPALDGVAGSPGLAICAPNESPFKPSPGGAEAQKACGDGQTSIGGKGGDGGSLDMLSPDPLPGGDGANGAPDASGAGLGGKGQADAAWTCSASMGANGVVGDSGKGAVGAGHVDAAGWHGIDGQPGAVGKPGQGGGGGGGARGDHNVCPGSLHSAGASGGSGGTGGCGGRGGGGGQAGGASIALLSVEASLVLAECRLNADHGGSGGRGGDGQPGGSGGSGGPGGKGGALADGCDGAKGGKGGKGGAGGGGMGGPSIALAFTGTKPQMRGMVPLAIAKGGPGGPGGEDNVAGNQGLDGVALETQQF
jgi:hypothetical protein